jgi:hypothetical protein
MGNDGDRKQVNAARFEAPKDFDLRTDRAGGRQTREKLRPREMQFIHFWMGHRCRFAEKDKHFQRKCGGKLDIALREEVWKRGMQGHVPLAGPDPASAPVLMAHAL